MNETEIVHKLNRHSLSHLFYHECYRKWNLEEIVWFLVSVDIVSLYLVLFSESFLSLNIHHVFGGNLWKYIWILRCMTGLLLVRFIWVALDFNLLSTQWLLLTCKGSFTLKTICNQKSFGLSIGDLSNYRQCYKYKNTPLWEDRQ